MRGTAPVRQMSAPARRCQNVSFCAGISAAHSANATNRHPTAISAKLIPPRRWRRVTRCQYNDIDIDIAASDAAPAHRGGEILRAHPTVHHTPRSKADDIF